MADEKEKIIVSNQGTNLPVAVRKDELSDEQIENVAGGIAGQPMSGQGE